MSSFRPLWAPLSVACAAALVLLVDAVLPARPGRQPSRAIGWLTAGLLAALFTASFFVDVAGAVGRGAWVGDRWTAFFARLLLGAGLLAVLGAVDDVAARTPRRQGEYYLLLLLALAGMLLLVGARDVVLLVVAFELMSIPLYALAAFAKTDANTDGKPGRRAAEAGLKLFLTGATSTALMLFGLALLVGMTGTARLDAIGAAPTSPLAAVGMLLLLGGMGWKLGLVPFHLWVPDAYEGAATPFVAFLSVGPKAAGLAALAVVFVRGFEAQRAVWQPALALVALLTMAIGNLLALPQRDLRRLFAYSGIAQMGYVLLAIVGARGVGPETALFFLAAYVVSNMGAFLVVHAVEKSGREVDDLAGLARRAPGLSLSLLMFVLSLAGIPFVVGFWAKLYLFLAAWRAGLVVLVGAGVLLAAVGLFYYLRVARAAFMLEAGDRPAPARPGLALRLAIGVCVVLVLGMGLWPRPVVESAAAAGRDLIAPTVTVARAR